MCDRVGYIAKGVRGIRAREVSRVSRSAELAFILHVACHERVGRGTYPGLERVNVLRAVAEWEIWFRGLFNMEAHAVFHLLQVPSPRDVLRFLREFSWTAANLR